VIDLTTGQEAKRLLAGRGAAIWNDPGWKFIYAHIYPNPEHFHFTELGDNRHRHCRQTVVERKSLHTWPVYFTSPCRRDGKLGVVTNFAQESRSAGSR